MSSARLPLQFSRAVGNEVGAGGGRLVEEKHSQQPEVQSCRPASNCSVRLLTWVSFNSINFCTYIELRSRYIKM